MPRVPLAAARQRALSAARKKTKEATKDIGKSVKKKAKEGARALVQARPTLLEVLLFALPLALLGDAIDILEITIVGKVLTIITDAIIGLILSVWLWFRSGQSVSRKLLKIVITFVAELFPVVGMAPLWTILVVNARTGWFNWIFAIPEKLLSL